MRHWTLQHPNVMVAFWAFLVGLLSFIIVDDIHDHDWFWLAVSALAQLCSLGNLRTWWERT